jgi:hypothetical protein
VPLGENIGQAYIRIFADGSNLDDDIRDSFRDQDDVIDGEGNRHSKRYADAFSEEMLKGASSKKMTNALRGSLSNALARNDALDQFIRSKKWTNFRAGLSRQYHEAGTLAGKRFEEALIEGMDYDELLRRTNNLTGEIASATREIQRMEIEAGTAAHKSRMDQIADLRTQMQLLTRESGQLFAGDRNARDKDELLTIIRHIDTEMVRLNYDNELWVETLADTERELRRTSPRLNEFNRGLDRTSLTIGRGLGYGSRNNFLNFIGSMAKNLTRLVGLPVRIASEVGGMYREFKLLQSLDFGKFRSGVGALGSLGGALGGVAGVAAGLLILLPPLASGLSLLAGVAAALAGSLTFAAFGALGGLAAIMAPLTGVALTAAAAFAGLSDAQKEALSNDLSPITGAFERLQEVARQPLFDMIREQASRLAPVIDSFQGSVRGIAEAMGSVGEGWVTAMRGPGFQKFTDAFENFMPRAVASLGESIEGFVGGMGGLFRGMIPFMEDALGWLERVTGKFSEWANSAKGQSNIIEFFDQAKQSLKDVGHFAGNAFELIWKILSAGQGTGDSLFRSMGDAIQGWIDKINANPRILSDWFDSALEFGRAIGDTIEAVGELFAAFDNGYGRSTITGFFTGLADVVEDVADVVSGLYGAFDTAVDSVTIFLSGVKGMWAEIGKGPFGNPLKGFQDGLKAGRELTYENVDAVNEWAASFVAVEQGITRVTRELAVQELQSSGVFDRAKEMGLNLRDVIGYAMGNEGAVKRVYDALGGMQNIDMDEGKLLDDLAGVGGLLSAAAAEGRETEAALTSLSKIKNKELKVDVRALGLDATVDDLKKLDRQYDLTPKEIRTIVKATGIDISKKDLASLIKELDKTGKKVTEPKADLDHKMFDQGKTVVDQAMKGIDNAVASARVVADTSGATGPIGNVRQMLYDLPTIKNITIKVSRQMGGEPLTADGGIFEGPRGIGVGRIIGEAGAEAVVPLNRPLSMVDPSVRWLSAIAQGLQPPAMASGGVVGGGRTIDVGGITVVTPTQDPVAVAHETINTLVATGY